MFTIKDDNEKIPRGEIVFKKGKYTGQTFTSDLMPCMSATCECGNIYVTFKDGTREFDVFLNTYLHAFIAEEGKVTSVLLNGFEVSISEIINQ